jgi:hypothetical protein
MPLLIHVLHHLPNIRKPQRTFLIMLFNALFHFFGRATRVNLARHGGPSERAQARWEEKAIDFPALTLMALATEGVLTHPMAAVLDASFLPKSGKHTWGVGKFWNGSHARVEHGREISTFGLVDLQEETAYALDTRQTPATLTEEKSRMDFYSMQVQEMKPRLPASVKYLLVDGGYTKKNFIDSVIKEQLHVVGKLRKDANLWYLHTGLQKKGRGRPRLLDGKAWFDELFRWETCLPDEDGAERWIHTLWHMSLKRKVRVVLIKYTPKRYVLLFSTDLSLDVDTLCKLYRLRFQVEFLFRDGKQHTGLGEDQMRSQEGQQFHMNASMTALNLLRLEARRENAEVYSLASAKKRKYNEEFARMIFQQLGLDSETPENQAVIKKVRSYGALAA